MTRESAEKVSEILKEIKYFEERIKILGTAKRKDKNSDFEYIDLSDQFYNELQKIDIATIKHMTKLYNKAIEAKLKEIKSLK